ncbi:hypothetical protein MFLAVUS_004308 [Mucor flavus]|uniref:Uncharacterized protein n=1 Tax=Mucor flavus TaxID=439312 RepID=A0ABP9YVI8_9FUNG
MDQGNKKNVPWKDLFFTPSFGSEIVGWPEELKLPLKINVSINFKGYKREHFLQLAKSFSEESIFFRRKEE